MNQNSEAYQEFLRNNSGKGNLRIRAFAASEALPVRDLLVVVSTKIGGEDVVFFSGRTDASGMIDTISLPAPPMQINNLETPRTVTYSIVAGDVPSLVFSINMYDGICVVQTINLVSGGNYGN